VSEGWREMQIRKTNRLMDYDYGAVGIYFVTICALNRQHIFGEIKNCQNDGNHVGAFIERPNYGTAQIILSDIGNILKQNIEKISQIYDGINVDKYVIMPNHIHMIISIIQEQQHGRSVNAPTISTIVRHLKAYTTRVVGAPIFQKSFHDHIIRCEKDYQMIWDYIEHNIDKWHEDRYY